MSRDAESLKRRRAEQLPLDFPHAASSARDDLIVASPLDAAIALLDRWPDWPTPVVILAGPTGSGKTHLTNIWRTRANACQIDAGPGNEDALSLATRSPVYIEDIDQGEFDETWLFHLFNTVKQNGSHLLITTRVWPAAWPVDLPDLRSRLKAATVVEIGEPDDSLLTQIMEKLFADRQIVIDPKIVSYLGTAYGTINRRRPDDCATDR